MTYDAISLVLELKSKDLNALAFTVFQDPKLVGSNTDYFIAKLANISDELKSLSTEVKLYRNEVQK